MFDRLQQKDGFEMKNGFVAHLFAFSAIVLLSGCSGQHSKPNFLFMPDMFFSPALKAQEEGANRMPVKGTVPRGFQPYAYVGQPDLAGKELKNPLPRTEATYKRGQAKYNTYCIVCHGPTGEGDGSVVPKFPKPPSLNSEKVQKWPDGNLYHVISAGQNLMPSYASQVSTADRWAIIHFIRALQRSKNPTAEDLKTASN